MWDFELESQNEDNKSKLEGLAADENSTTRNENAKPDLSQTPPGDAEDPLYDLMEDKH